MAQTDDPGRKNHGFSSQGHPSVPFVLALPVSATDGAETDVPETEVPDFISCLLSDGTYERSLFPLAFSRSDL